ncbi:hypothetical protein BABINDRAFT_88731 [Babjeviella inositovora NRRL Y-12698]|uniref:Uncharacterized protein n=1 Tax=Babjeviella inositovora NRRL Y-12698 TaxID=984486 RepID=A0A1E3QKM0_9ASCO|nr:uncharacterized protein BABINDRAFT_88731 [Babjeviella inositovora NRRL Y-12698]ODQ78231.1 hypothetical protein BABINDRAFT_88731 [Babjeviella inositovora NRRL Y-12698]
MAGPLFGPGSVSIGPNLKSVCNLRSWNSNACVTFLDRPVGVGYSYLDLTSMLIDNGIFDALILYSSYQIMACGKGRYNFQLHLPFPLKLVLYPENTHRQGPLLVPFLSS